jgi:hypothetical protein
MEHDATPAELLQIVVAATIRRMLRLCLLHHHLRSILPGRSASAIAENLLVIGIATS